VQGSLGAPPSNDFGGAHGGGGGGGGAMAGMPPSGYVDTMPANMPMSGGSLGGLAPPPYSPPPESGNSTPGFPSVPPSGGANSVSICSKISIFISYC